MTESEVVRETVVEEPVAHGVEAEATAVPGESEVLAEPEFPAEPEAPAEPDAPAEPEPEPTAEPETPAEPEPEAPAIFEPLRQWTSLSRGACDVRLGHGALELMSAVTKGSASTQRNCEICIGQGASAELVEAVRRQMTDAGHLVSMHELPSEEACLSVEAASNLASSLAKDQITSDDLVVVLGHTAALSLVTFVTASWCGGVELSCVPLDLAAAVLCPATPRALDIGEARERVGVVGHAKSYFVDLNELCCDPDDEQVRLARSMMVHAALADSEKAFSTLWDRANDLVSGDIVSLATQLIDTIKSRGRLVASTAVAQRQSITMGQSFVRALTTLAPEVPLSICLAEALRFQSRLSCGLEYLSVDDVLAIDELLERLAMGSAHCDVDPEALVATLKAERFARSRRFMLGLPRALGRVRLATVDDALLLEHARAWCAVHRQ